MQVGHFKRIRVIKRVLKIFWLTVVAIASVVFAGVLAVQLPQVQTFITEKVVTKFTDRLDGDIVFEKIHFKPFTTLILKNVAVIDRNPVMNPNDPEAAPVDTLFSARYIIARFSLDGLIRQECVHLNKAYISDARMTLVLENKEDAGDGDIATENLSRIFRIKKPEQPRRSEKEIFHIKKVEINNMFFCMKNHKAEEIPYHGGINWNDMQVSGININARELQFKAGIMSGELDHLDFREKSGWVCESLTGSAKVGRGKTILTDLRIKDRWSDINMPLFMMSYKNSKEFKYFIDKVRIDSEIERTILDFRTLWYFAPQLYGNDLKTSLSGKVGGVVSGFNFDNLRIASADGGFSGRMTGSIIGLPEIESTVIKAGMNDFLMTTEGLSGFIRKWTRSESPDLSRFARGLLFSMNGNVSGPLDRLSIETSITSLIGKAGADICISDILSPERSIGISGRISADDLDIGRIIDRKFIGRTTLCTGFSARLGNESEKPEARIDSLIVDRLFLNGYDYSSIAAAGAISKDAFDGKVICNDPNLNFMFQGTFALSAKTHNSLYRFYANIGHADLNAINIDKRGLSKVRLQAHADFTSTSEGEVIGNADVADIMLENADGRYEIGDIILNSHSSGSDHRMILKSEFASATFNGTSPFSSFFKDILDITAKKELPSLFRNPDYTWENDRYDFRFVCHDLIDILSFAMPGLYVESGTELNINVNEEGLLDAGLNSGRIAFRKQYMKGLTARFDNLEESFNADLKCDEIMVASVKLSDNTLQAHADDNHLGIGFTYDNHSELINRGEFILSSTFSRDEDGMLETDLEIKPSSLYLNSKKWDILPASVALKGHEMKVKSFGLTSGEEFIGMNGGTSEFSRDTLGIELHRFDISILNNVLGDKFGIKGSVTGNARITSPLPEKGILIDMICDSTHIASRPLGIVSIGSRLNEEKGGFDIALINEIEGRNSIILNGNIALKEKRINAEAQLDRLGVGYVQPVLSDIFSEMDGSITGKVNINGHFDDLDITSEGTSLNDAMLTIAYTDVPYYADGSFHIDRHGVYFDDISLKDRYTGTGTVGGNINWNNFKDFTFNTRINVNEIEGIDLNEDKSEDFYGNIFGTGNISITGPMNSLVLSVDAVTAKTGQLHIPVSAATSAGKGTNLLKFTEEEKEVVIDPYEAMISDISRKEEAENDFTVRLRVNAQPDVEAFVEIDKASGNVLSGRGNGIIDLEIGRDLFEINGDYTLTGGNYKFVAIGLVSRDFEIQDGSSVRFNGDIMESTLDIDALYKTKASLTTLIADTTSVANRRTVECGINITEKISNPRLSFSIEIPDLDPMVQSRVESALSTDDKIQKQFLSLLLSNSFLPDEQSGIVNNTTLLYSNVTEAMANQLNNIFQKLDIPLDLGLNYQPNEKGNDIFDVAVSTQLFNNRVVVNGSVGNKQNTSGGGTQDVVGDLDIEIKLDRSGAFRLNLFSHSADSYTNYLDNSQRNGVGFSYQTEFYSMKQFLKNMFSSKARRQAAKQAEEKAMIDGGRVEMKIEASDKNKRNERGKR